MGDSDPKLGISSSCTVAPSYWRCDINSSYKGKGKSWNNLTLDINAHHEMSRDGLGIPTSGIDAYLTGKNWFVNALIHHVDNDEEHLHSQSNALDSGFGFGGRWKYPFKKYFSFDHLVAGGLIIQHQPIGNLNPYDGSKGYDDGGVYFWPIFNSMQSLSLTKRAFHMSVRHGFGAFGQARLYHLSSDTNAILLDWHASTELMFTPSHYWKKKFPLDMTMVMGVRYMSGIFSDGFGENADAYFGTTIGQKLKNTRWTLDAKYTHPMRRDLHAGDVLPEGRYQALTVDGTFTWKVGKKGAFLLTSGIGRFFRDRDEMTAVAPPMKNYLYVGLGYQHGPFAAFARAMIMGDEDPQTVATVGISFNFDLLNSKSYRPIESLQPALPPQHLPSAASVGMGYFSTYGIQQAIYTRYPGGTSLTEYGLLLVEGFLKHFIGSYEISANDGTVFIVRDEQGIERVFNPGTLFSEVDAILSTSASGAEKARRLIDLGKRYGNEYEKLLIISYAIGQYTRYNNDRSDHPLDPANWNTWTLDKVLGSNSRVCRDATRAFYDYLNSVGIPSTRLKKVVVDYRHIVLFYQLKDGPNKGYWMVLDQGSVFEPIKTKNLDEAVSRYSVTSYGRGVIEPNEGPFGTSRYNWHFTGQWQRMRKSANQLITPRR